MINKYHIELLKKFRKLHRNIFDEFIKKQGFTADDVEWVESDRGKFGDIVISLDLILKDFQYNAPVGAILEYLDSKLSNTNSDIKDLSYYEFLKFNNKYYDD